MLKSFMPLVLAASGLLAQPVLADTATQPESSAVPSAAPLTLAETWRLAEQANVSLRQEQARLDAAQGAAADAARPLHNNPQLSIARTRRGLPPDGAGHREWSAGVEQTFEIAGQQGYRRRASQAELDALRASIEEVRRSVRASVEQQFVRVLALQERIATERSSLQLVEDAAAAVRKRVAAGEDNRLDGNVAQVEAVRARNQIGALQEQLIQARAELAKLLQLPPSRLPDVSGSLEQPTPGYTLDELLTQARSRPLLRAFEYREQAAESRLSLERASRYPDVTVGFSRGREGPYDAREDLKTFSVSLPLPLFQRNAAGIGRAATELGQARIERQAARRDTQAEVVALWRKLQSLAQRVDELQKTVLPALEENQRLSTKSLQAGEIGLVQLLLINRQVLDGRRDLIDAEEQLRQTQVALQQAAGWPSALSQ